MYDRQLWYWPHVGASIILKLYLDGSYLIECDDSTITDQQLIDLMNEANEAIMDIDDFLDIKGLVFVDHLKL